MEIIEPGAVYPPQLNFIHATGVGVCGVHFLLNTITHIDSKTGDQPAVSHSVIIIKDLCTLPALTVGLSDTLNSGFLLSIYL